MPPIPESVALAQPIIYILGALLIGVIIVFVGLIKWLMNQYILSLSAVVHSIVEQNEEQTTILRRIDERTEKIIEQTDPKKTRPKRGRA